MRNKILAYEQFYDHVLARWKCGDIEGPRPKIRVLFWTDSTERAEHILYAASRLARNPDRFLVYATTMDLYLNEDDALMAPIFVDHRGNYQAIVDVYPTSEFLRKPVEIRAPKLAQSLAFC